MKRVVLTHRPTGTMYVVFFEADGTGPAGAVMAALDPDPAHWHLSWERRHRGAASRWGSL